MEIRRIGRHRAKLGEGPLWDPVDQALYWVDSVGRTLHRLDYHADSVESWGMPSMIGSLALRASAGAVVALRDGIYLLDFDSGELAPVADPERGNSLTRFNDGKVDRQGRFLTGTMGIRVRDRGLGALYRLDSNLRVETLLTDVIVSNGPCFSPEGDRFYFTDGRRRILRWDYHPDSGALSNRRVHIDMQALGTASDGATVDAEGCLWTALIGSGEVARFSPDAELLERIEMPCALPSSVMFGGPNLDQLFVTSISDSGTRRADGPDDGALFVIEGLGVIGLPEPRFKG